MISMTTFVSNKKAKFDFELKDTFEAGLVLLHSYYELVLIV